MKKSATAAILMSLSFSMYAQPRDTAFISASYKFLKQQYSTGLNGELPVFAGGGYAEYVPLADEHPYYLNNDWAIGTIVYQGDVYDSMPLQYDIATESLLTEHATSARKIKLANDRISSFTLDGRQFYHIHSRDYERMSDAGFYELLVDGETKLFARRKKSLQKQVVSGKLVARFDEANRYFIAKNDQWIPVRSKSSLLKALADKPAFKQELKRSGPGFNSNREQALIFAVNQYNKLN